jgi:hypothetical protein
MNSTALNKYKKRFEVIKKIERAENQKLSLQQKFIQLAALVSLGIGMGFDSGKRDKLFLKSNWTLLKT